MEVQDIVNMLDIKYGWGSKDRVLCPNDGRLAKLPQSGTTTTNHGYLCVARGGANIVCGWCGYTMPVGIG